MKLEFEIPFEFGDTLYMLRKEYMQCGKCAKNKTGRCNGQCPRIYRVAPVSPRQVVVDLQTQTPRVVIRTVEPPYETFTLSLSEVYQDEDTAKLAKKERLKRENSR
jgi:hypothetical protein